MRRAFRWSSPAAIPDGSALAYVGRSSGAPPPASAHLHRRRGRPQRRTDRRRHSRGGRRIPLRQSLRGAQSTAPHRRAGRAEAHALLRRDVDYLVKNGAIEMVDEFKGRIALNRRWPAGLQTAVEAKEGVAPEVPRNGSRVHDDATPGRALSAGLRHDRNGRYAGDRVSDRVRSARGDDTHEPADRSASIIRTSCSRRRPKRSRRSPRRSGASTPRASRFLWGRPASRSPRRLSGMLTGLPHRVLNARNDEAEAAIVARGGRSAAPSPISTNMAGRGTDIRLARERPHSAACT